jgi:hypothetical protein
VPVVMMLILLNFEIVSSIGSSAGHGRISQQEEILFLTRLQGARTALANRESIR